MGAGECDLFLARCGLLRVSVTFIWLGVGECGKCNLYLVGWWWVRVSVTLFWLGVGKCG